MKKRTLDGVSLECIQGDIANQPDMIAIVNAANAQLRPGGGVAGAIHRAAGPGLDAECRPLAPIRPGEAVVTGAHNLPNRYVIHCLGPVYGQDQPSERLLAACYHNSMRLAESMSITSIAFPAISTGVFGYPTAEAARVAFSTILAECSRFISLRHIRFVLYSKADFRLHERILCEMLEKQLDRAERRPNHRP